LPTGLRPQSHELVWPSSQLAVLLALPQMVPHTALASRGIGVTFRGEAGEAPAPNSKTNDMAIARIVRMDLLPSIAANRAPAAPAKVARDAAALSYDFAIGRAPPVTAAGRRSTASRREVLSSLLLAGAAGALAAGPARGGSIATVGLQLYTVRALLERDYEGTLARIAALGYRRVEFAGLYASSIRQTAELLKRHGLSAPSGHASWRELARNLAGALATANELGQQFIVCPSVDEAERRTLDDWRRLGERFNRIGEEARRAGLRFAYHNHDFEFRPVGGQVPYDVLLAATDPALVGMEIDLYWVTRAGGDPLAYFRKHPGRFPLAHLKDMARDGAITEVGRGVIDFRRILDQAALAGLVHGFVEHDEPKDALDSIEASLRYVQHLDV